MAHNLHSASVVHSVAPVVVVVMGVYSVVPIPVSRTVEWERLDQESTMAAEDRMVGPGVAAWMVVAVGMSCMVSVALVVPGMMAAVVSAVGAAEVGTCLVAVHSLIEAGEHRSWWRHRHTVQLRAAVRIHRMAAAMTAAAAEAGMPHMAAAYCCLADLVVRIYYYWGHSRSTPPADSDNDTP